MQIVDVTTPQEQSQDLRSLNAALHVAILEVLTNHRIRRYQTYTSRPRETSYCVLRERYAKRSYTHFTAQNEGTEREKNGAQMYIVELNVREID